MDSHSGILQIPEDILSKAKAEADANTKSTEEVLIDWLTRSATPTPPPIPVPIESRLLGLAFDGGGMKGIVIAKALEALEEKLKVKRIVDYPQLRVLGGSSSGAIIAVAIALGWTAKKLQDFYKDNGDKIFQAWAIEKRMPTIIRMLTLLRRPSRYESSGLETLLQAETKHMTLGDLHNQLNPDPITRNDPSKFKSLVLTVYDVQQRRTRFFKTSEAEDQNIPLWAAIRGSGAAPTFFPVMALDSKLVKASSVDAPTVGIPPTPEPERDTCYFIDGGVGNYNNPAYIVAREMIEWRGFQKQESSIWSFGVGFVGKKAFITKYAKNPSKWYLKGWIDNLVDLIMADATRAQSFNIIDDYYFVDKDKREFGIDFRRYQVATTERIVMDKTDEKTIELLCALGTTLGNAIRDNCYGPVFTDRIEVEPAACDPEQIGAYYMRRVQTKKDAPKANTKYP